MNSNTAPSASADYLFKLLEPLSHSDKLTLIVRLSESLRKELKPADSVPLSALFGAYKAAETAEEMIADLRAARLSNRFTEPL